MNKIVNTSNITGLEDASYLLSRYEITEKDISNIKKYGKIIVKRLDEYVVHFYEWMKNQPEYTEFFSNDKMLISVQNRQIEYWQEFFAGEINNDYFEQRRLVGETHARINLSLDSYLAGANKSMTILMEDLYDNSLSAKAYAEAVASASKLVNLDSSIIVSTFAELTNRTIAEQSETLMKMSTPVAAIWQGILLLPVVGIIDSKRAQDIMNAMLIKIAETQSKVIILDISGVGMVDTAVANHLIKITKATKLMGCECTISGLSPAIAQTIVELGIDVDSIATTANLKDALESAFSSTGITIKASP
ncbi:MAG: anti-anti-sigma factor [SAR86 cluster bacterium]|uniref:Anti-anti-sigma factor n=1 Tax=SAR86 cluster bacterium TaxID=2030880 RepID=A0A2A4XER7_9GAMM|nr:MAG: anti-anti-sigma factor [SAR86 cluster bacterium]